MGERVEEIEHDLIQYFPMLSTDISFKVTSKATPIYKFIAWAYNFTDRWMLPDPGKYSCSIYDIEISSSLIFQYL